MSKPDRWVRNLLIVPAVVALLSAIVSLVLPRLLPERPELSYSIDYTIADSVGGRHSVPGASVVIDYDLVVIDSLTGKRVPEEIVRINLWNSGSTPIKDLAIGFLFRGDARGDPVWGIRQYAMPYLNLGRPQPDSIALVEDGAVHRFQYELLNPGEELSVVATVRNGTSAAVLARAPGLRVIHRASMAPTRRWSILSVVLWLTAGAIAAGVVLSINWSFVAKRIFSQRDAA